MKFKVILADCPWLYDDARTEKSAGMALSAYDCMPLTDICALPVQDIAAENCMLCLWATMPKLQEALDVIKAWGFKYVTCGFVWIKARPNWDWPTHRMILENDIYSGIGHYTNANAELVLIGRKGHYWREDRNVKQILVAPRRAHSQKPREIHERIERLFGDGPRIELFAREPVNGWFTLGEEIDGKSIAEALIELGAL